MKASEILKKLSMKELIIMSEELNVDSIPIDSKVRKIANQKSFYD